MPGKASPFTYEGMLSWDEEGMPASEASVMEARMEGEWCEASERRRERERETRADLGLDWVRGRQPRGFMDFGESVCTLLSALV